MLNWRIGLSNDERVLQSIFNETCHRVVSHFDIAMVAVLLVLLLLFGPVLAVNSKYLWMPSCWFYQAGWFPEACWYLDVRLGLVPCLEGPFYYG